MADGSPARFRIRIGGGEELGVGSVEELSRLVESGEVGPDTSLHDAGTGQWGPASEIPVVRFVVEELRREGREPPGWSALAEGPFSEGSVEVEEGAGSGEGWELDEPLELEELPFTPDPFEMHLPRGGADPPPEKVEPEAAAPEGESEAGIRPPGEETALPGAPDEADAAPRFEFAAAPAPEAAEERPVLEGEDEWKDWLPPDEQPEAASTLGPRPAPEDGRARRRRRMAAGLGVGVLAVLVLATLLRPEREGEAGTDGPPPGGESPAALASPPGVAPVPAALAPAFAALSAGMGRTLDFLVDSLRTEAGLPPAPPREWLGGYYLSNASLFEEVPEFWLAYGRLAIELRDGDRALYGEALERALEELDEDSLGGASRASLRTHVAGRYPALRAMREERYVQLAGAAQAAVDLHHFLVRHEDRIAYTPALGRGVSADPILEAVPATSEIRREMEALLDRVFQALDRSRRGGAPSPEGLRVELFQRFGDPV